MSIKTNAKHSPSSAQCPTCGHMFASEAAFDQHRSSGLGTSAPRARCMTTNEMRERGFELDRWKRLKAPPKPRPYRKGADVQ